MSDHAPFHILPGGSDVRAETFWVGADDGIRLRLGLWRTSYEPAAGTILLFPGRTEYIEKYAPIAEILTSAGYVVLAIDWRGQGLSDRLQGDPRPGHVGAFGDYQRDVVEMVVAADDMELPQPWHLLAHSMGGAIGLAALDGGLPVRSAVFSAPMWNIALHRTQRQMALGLSYLAGRVGRGGRSVPRSGSRSTYLVDQAFQGNVLTPDVDEWCRLLREAHAWPDLTIGGASFDWLGKALHECARLSALPSPEVPMTVIFGSDEKVVSTQAIHNRTQAWPGARILVVEGARHEVMMGTPDHRHQFLKAALQQFSE